jgi:DNA-binding LacI/PurR family transcriptional regulator
MEGETATIRDVAAAAGCSIATVSRVITGNGPVSEAMHKRVVAAALQLGFRLDREDRAPRRILCVLVPSLTNPVFAAALSGIEQRARAGGLSTIMAQSHYDTSQEERVVGALIAERPLGLILTLCDPAQSPVLELVARQRLPTATIYNAPTETASLYGAGAVLVDNVRAMAMLVDGLTALGHRRILFVGGRFASSDRSQGRYDGYRAAMEAVGCAPLAPMEVDFIDATQDIDLTAGMHQHRPTAIVASNDLLAITVIASLRRIGLSVPEDVSVTGFDGIEVGGHLSPRLTTVSQPSRNMGLLAASLVIDMAAGRRRAETILADVTLVRGETTAPPKPQLAARPTTPRSPLATGAHTL